MKPGTGRRPIDAAVVYAKRGWAVFPCNSPGPSPGGCSCGAAECGSVAKHPRIAGGLKSATTDQAQIERWWQQWPRANVAIRTGEVSHLVVVDVDPGHGGDASLDRLIDEHGCLPDGRVVRTGSGGRHLYFLHPGGVVRNDAGRRLGRGLDIRGDGGYVIAPPSRHASGGRYVVGGHGGDIPELPDWLQRLLRPPEPQRSLPQRSWKPTGDNSRWAQAAFAGELRRLQEAQPGMRNHMLNKVAYRLGQIIGGEGSLDQLEVEGALLNGAKSLGLGEREAAATVKSGLSAGVESPRGPVERPPPDRHRATVEIDGP